jgi:hypothetical protein
MNYNDLSYLNIWKKHGNIFHFNNQKHIFFQNYDLLGQESRNSKQLRLFCPEKAAGSSEMLVPVHQTTWWYIPEDHNLGINCHKDFKSLTFLPASAFRIWVSYLVLLRTH